ncbi:hypothetical protein C0992_000952 [Termitomyces sp. T32_za158]|nr:hypothetical protein C0992_000952 [Termitomyces sp. T32_za158]
MGQNAHPEIDETKFNGFLPSRADGKASKMEHAEEILRIAGNFIRALEYDPPPFPQDPALHKGVIDELRSWNICLFHARKPQLHPVLDCYAKFMLRLYDHYEPYVAAQMVMSSVTFMLGSCIEVRSLEKNMKHSTDAILWPYYVRSLSG